MDSDLPFVDEHQELVAASAPAVWSCLIAELPLFARGGAFTRLIGVDPAGASGASLGEGATLPGFRVAEAVPGQRLRLSGRHRFSRYELILSLVAQADATMLSARTNAEFPGLHGSVYRLLVIGSGMHRVLVKRLLRTIRDRAQDLS